jgi:plastocyanin
MVPRVMSQPHLVYRRRRVCGKIGKLAVYQPLQLSDQGRLLNNPRHSGGVLVAGDDMKPLIALTILLACTVTYSQRQQGQEESKNTISIVRMQYNPATLTVKVGETVTWKNDDDRDHTVEGENGSFKSGNIRPGRKFEHTFTRAGRYPYACAYHPRMKGEVVVEE